MKIIVGLKPSITGKKRNKFYRFMNNGNLPANHMRTDIKFRIPVEQLPMVLDHLTIEFRHLDAIAKKLGERS